MKDHAMTLLSLALLSGASLEALASNEPHFSCNHQTHLKPYQLQQLNTAPPPELIVPKNHSGSLYGMQIIIPTEHQNSVSGDIVSGNSYLDRGYYGWGVTNEMNSRPFTFAIHSNGSYTVTLFSESNATMIQKLGGKNTLTEAFSYKQSSPFAVNFTDADTLAASGTRGTSHTIRHLFVYEYPFLGAQYTDSNGNPQTITMADIETRAMNTISNLSLAYSNSAINVSPELAYVYLSDNNSASNPIDLSDLSNINDGSVDEIADVRNLVSADLGTYVRYGGASGNSSGGASQGYGGGSALWLNFGTLYLDDFTVALSGGNTHEIGHSMGMAHGRDDTTISPDSSIPYAYGYCMPIEGLRTSMQSAAPCTPPAELVTLQYSNPDISGGPSNEAWGIDHDIDPSNSADGARAQNITAPIVANFRSTTPVYPDCDSDGILDVIEIAQGTQLDCDEDGVPDACQIASNPGDDCDTNGVPDSCQLTELNPTITRSIQPGAVTSFAYDLTGTPTVKSNVTMTVTSRVKCTNTFDWDVYIDSTYMGTLFDSTTLNNACNGINTDTITLSGVPENMGELEIQITQGTINVGGLSCNEAIEIELTYHTDAPNDINRNGVFDACEPGCTPYDIAAPFGQFTQADLDQFTTWYSNNDLRADFSPPFGTLNYFDVSAFSLGYQADCP